jgi:hypothetical protein
MMPSDLYPKEPRTKTTPSIRFLREQDGTSERLLKAGWWSPSRHAMRLSARTLHRSARAISQAWHFASRPDTARTRT